MSNTRDRNIDSARRDDRMARLFEQVEIVRVWPHINKYIPPKDGDKDFNVCDIQLIDRPFDPESGKFPVVQRTRLKVLQQWYGHLQGTTYNPRIGDLVLIAWINDREAIILGQLPSAQQEPVCRSLATWEDQERVCKRSYWECPEMDKNKNYVIFPTPKHPECMKWWPIKPDGTPRLDDIWIQDCLSGHFAPHCNYETPCNGLDDIQDGTFIKKFGYYTDQKDGNPDPVPWLYKFHHYCGSIYLFNNQGDYFLQNKINPDDYKVGRFIDEDSLGYIGVFGAHTTSPSYGTWRMRAQPDTSRGAMLRVISPRDNPNLQDPVANELIWEHPENANLYSYVRIYKNGIIELFSLLNTTTHEVGASITIDGTTSKITLNAASVEETGNNKTDGSNTILGHCTHAGCSCPDSPALAKATQDVSELRNEIDMLKKEIAELKQAINKE